MRTTCNNCLDEFDLSPEDITIKHVEGLEIQFFLCPSCGARYVIYAADEEMEKLTSQSMELQKKIRLARERRFREKTIRGIELELAKVGVQQKKLEPKLKQRAELLLLASQNEDDDKPYSGLLEAD